MENVKFNETRFHLFGLLFGGSEAAQAGSVQNHAQELQQEKLSHQQLHEEVYYNPLFAYEKGKAGQEERPAEYAQKEKQLDLEKDSEAQVKKDQDIATQRAQREYNA